MITNIKSAGKICNTYALFIFDFLLIHILLILNFKHQICFIYLFVKRELLPAIKFNHELILVLIMKNTSLNYKGVLLKTFEKKNNKIYNEI